MPVIRAALERGQRVRMTANGSSMLPFIHDGDIVELEPISASPKIGDIVLAQNPGGGYVVHRVVRARGESFYLRGDAQTCSEGPLAPENMLGKVIQSEHRGRVRNHARGIWRILGLAWVKIHPAGFYLFRLFLKFWCFGGKVLRRL